jgi:F0F1-type ATP synthase delta subunit
MKKDLSKRLFELKSLRKAYKSLGNRAKNLSDPMSVRLEYPEQMTLEMRDEIMALLVEKYSLDTNIVFLPRSNLTGGVRLFVGDKLLDVSFEQMKQKLIPIL